MVSWVYAARVERESETGNVERSLVLRISVADGTSETVVDLPPGDLGVLWPTPISLGRRSHCRRHRSNANLESVMADAAGRVKR